MKTLFTRQGLVISLTLAGIIALVAVYLFKYVPENEHKLKNRRFRALERSQLNLESKIKNSFQFLETQLRSYTDVHNNDTGRMNGYLASLNTTSSGFRLGVVKEVNDAGQNFQQIDFGNDSVRCTYRLRQSGNTFELGISFGSENFIRSLLPKNLFDEFILVKDSSLLFATFPAGNQTIKSDSAILNFATSLPVSSEGIVQIAGEQYRIFLQPLRVDDKSQWMLGGLLQERRFVSERSQLDPKKVLTLITISIMLLILLPWIKLFFMGSRDRLTHTDGFLSFLVAMLMLCMIFFVFAQSLPGSNTNRSLGELSDSIGASFNREIRTAKDLLNEFDDAIANNESIKRSIVCLDTSECRPDFSVGFAAGNKKVDDTLDRVSKEFFENESAKIRQLRFNYVYWLDKDGNELYNWAAKNLVRPHQNFKERRYFKAHQGNGNRGVADTVIDQVVSWTTNDFKTVISKPSKLKNGIVEAISINIRSMEDHILPEGYMAMVINYRGDVLYHSDKSLNLNEYLPEEFEDSSDLKSAIYSRTKENFIASYHGSKFHVQCTPIEQSGYLLVLRNQSYENTRDINAFSFALGMYGIFFIILLLQYICMVSLFSRRSGLNFKLRLVDTLFPSKALQPAYRCAAIGNLFMIVLLACFNKTGVAIHIYMLLCAVAINAIFINLICARQHGVDANYRMAASKQKNAIVLVAILMLYDLVILLSGKIGETWRVFLFEGLAIAGLTSIYGWFYFKGALLKTRPGPNTGFIRSYAWMAVTRIIITSGIPVLFFYIDAFNYEQGLQTRRAQKQYSFRYARGLRTSKADTMISAYRTFADQYLITDAKFLKGIKAIDPGSDYPQVDIGLFDKMRLLDDTISIANNNLYHDSLAIDAGRFYGDTSFVREIPARGGSIVVRSNVTRLQLFPGIDNMQWVSWLWLIAALVVFYHVIKTILDRIFAIHFTEHSTMPDVEGLDEFSDITGAGKKLTGLEERLLQKTGCLEGEQRFNFIIATPGAGTAEAIARIRQNTALSKKIFILDLYTAFHNTNNTEALGIEEAADGKYQCLIIDHFEYLLHNTDLHRSLIKILEKWSHRRNGSVSIISCLHPADFHDRLCEYPDTIKNADPGKAAMLQEYALRWEDVLGLFNIAFMGMACLKVNQQEVSGLLQFLQQELQWGDFLNECFNQYKNEFISTTATKTGNVSAKTIPASED